MQDVANEVGGGATPSTIISNPDTFTKQLLALANREGSELSQCEGASGGWPQLQETWTFSTVISQATYALPANLMYFIPSTAWDTGLRWRIAGSMSPQEWQFLKSGYVASLPPYRFRIVDGVLEMDPVPASVTTISMEFFNNGWCKAAGGAAQTEWLHDSDVAVLPEELFTLGVKWRFLRAKGFDYDQEFKDYERAVERNMARSAPARDLYLTRGQLGVHILDDWNVPDQIL